MTDPVTDAVYELAEIAQRARDDAAVLEAIVRELADNSSPHDHEYGECMLCAKISRNDPIQPSDHAPECAWRRAVEWVEAHLAPDAGQRPAG